jgi:hypothetical protein
MRLRVNKKRKDTGGYYAVIELGEKSIGEDLENCFKVLCTNKVAVSGTTGIKYHRLVYLFVKKRRSFVVENNHLIIKFSMLYKGNQVGNINPDVYKRGND